MSTTGNVEQNSLVLDENAAGEDTKEAGVASKGSYFDGLAVSRNHKVLFGVIMLAYFFEQMDNMNFGYVAQAMFDTWGLSRVESNSAMGVILSFYFVGMTLGGFLGGIISDLIGRRKTFLGSIILFSVCSVITGLPIDNLYVFAIARALTGFGVFCMMVCSQVYIAEMSPSESRGKWQGIIGAVGFCAIPVVGIICTAVVPLSPEAWRYIFFFGGTGLIAFAVGMRYLKESPRWLVSQNRQQEAEDVLEFFTGQPANLSKESANAPGRGNVIVAIKSVFSRQYIKRTSLLMLVFITLTPASFIVTSWLPKLLSNMSLITSTGDTMRVFTQREALGMMTIITCGLPLGCFLASRVAEYGGRKLPLAICCGLSSVCCIVFTVIPATKLAIITVGMACTATSMAASMVLMTYTAEHFPTRIRNTANGTLNGIGRLAVAGMQGIIPALLIYFGSTTNVLNGDIKIVFTLCSILLAIPVMFILAFGERTGGKSLEEIS